MTYTQENLRLQVKVVHKTVQSPEENTKD